MKHCQWALSLITMTCLSGCLLDDDKGTSSSIPYAECSIPDANQKTYDYFKDDYFWYQDLPDAFHPEAFADVKEAVSYIRGSVDKDRFSFAMTTEEYRDYQASVFFGYGFSHIQTAERDGLLIRYVYENGSAAEKGLRRGDIIREVDGVSMADILVNVANGSLTLSQVFGANEEGVTIDVKFEKPNGDIESATFKKGKITANTVMAAQVKPITIDGQDKSVGYLVFDSFDNKSEEELNTAFDAFKLVGIDEMVLDLRYNSGGLIRVAKQLSTQIAGDTVEDEIFAKYVHNDKLSSKNRDSLFSLGAGIEKMNLERLIVLTTGGSCSASELVVNSLSPFIEVVVIGESSCGKPVGMYPEEVCDHVVFAINFQTQNATGFGDYFGGLPVDCPVADGVTGDWGVDSDPLLSEGLFYLQNDKCSASGGRPSLGAKGYIQQEVDWSQGPWKAKRVE